MAWPHFTLQFGGRVDQTNFTPDGALPDRDFTEYSVSAGALIRPQAASDNLVIAFSFARAARNPALEELYFFGPHPGNLSFEIGNPFLKAERALGFDVSVRARSARVQGEVTVFRNDIDDFIFRNPLSEEEFAARAGEFEERFGLEHQDGPLENEFPVIEFNGTDAMMWGVEAHADVTITERIGAELTYDGVRAERDDRRPADAADSAAAAGGRAPLHAGAAAGGRQRQRGGPAGPRVRRRDRDGGLRAAPPATPPTRCSRRGRCRR